MRFLFVKAILSWGLATAITQAHIVEQLYLSVQENSESLALEVTFDAAYALSELRNDATSPQPSRDWLVNCSPDKHQKLRRGAEDYLRESLQLYLNGELLAYGVSFPDYQKTPPDFPTLLNGGAYFRVLIKSDVPVLKSGDIHLAVTSGEHPDFIIAVKEGKDTSYVVVEPGKSSVIYSILPSGKIEPHSTGMISVFLLGYRHVIPDGLDHVLFILGLFLMARKWQPLLSQSLIFTLAHSLTLGLAASGVLNIQQWPGAWLIEPLIALSIAAIAVENIFYQKTGVRRLLLVFTFGLIHGLGFAGSLGTVLNSDGNWLQTLALANIGVEAAQVSLIAIAWCLTIKWSETDQYDHFRKGASVTIACIGLWWTIERLIT